MGLRAYQTKALQDIQKGFEEFDKQLGVLPTGAGKTILFSRIAKDLQPERTLILAHREELITQAVDKLRDSTGIEAEVEMGENRASLDAPVVVASVQTLMREKRRERWPKDHFGLVVVDECFPAGTLIDGRAIESISEGDVVNAFDHASTKLVKRKVTRVFRRQTDRICRIQLSDGRQIVCTPCHPFWNGDAYVPADQLTQQSVVYGITESHLGSMQTLQRDGGVPWEETELPESQRNSNECGVLLAGMQGRVDEGAERQGNGGNQSQVCIAAHAGKQPDAQPGIQGEDDDHAPGDGLDAPSPRGEWQALASRADAAGLSIGVGNGSGSAHEATTRQRLPDLLQDRHRKQDTPGRSGGGRCEPLLFGEAVAGSQKGGIAPVARVEGVAIFQRGCDPEFDQLCPGGAVFNLEVEEHHNYFVEGILVHNCHHVLADSYLQTLSHFDDHAKVLGVTATSDRGDKRNLGRYFENIACEINLLDLIKQGWLSPIRVKTVPLEMDLSGVRTSRGDFSADDLGHALEPYLEKIADVMVEHRHRKTIVFLPLIAVSKRFAEICRERGLLAEHVDGQTSERKAALERFRKNETRILTNAMLLTEGYDEPSIDCVVCLRPTKVRALYSQIIGRGTRIWPGKDHLLVLDFLWQSEEHSLIRPAHLIAEDEADAKALTEKLGNDGDLEDAREGVDSDRTRTLTDRLTANLARRGTTIDPLELAVSLKEVALADYQPTMEWQAQEPTAKQLDVLSKFGLDTDCVRTKGQASLILDRLIMRRKLGLATPKQVRVLVRHGHPQPETATFEEARNFLDSRFKTINA
jgi:superfamily II DNA or RNA helicase